MRPRYVGSLLPISTTTTDPERTYPWGKTHPKRARFNHPKSVLAWPFAKPVDSTIATNDEQPEYRVRANDSVPPASTASVFAGPQVRRFSSVRKLATRAARLATVLTENPPARPHGLFVRDKPAIRFTAKLAA